MQDMPADKLAGWAVELGAYWRESVRPSDFARLMRVRLSQSKIGGMVTPNQIRVTVNLQTLGPGVTLRSHTTDISVLKELLVGNSYTPLPDIPGAALIVDLGANIGLSFRYLRTRYPSARFVLVEPDPGNLEVLQANVRTVDSTAIIHAACIGGRERQVALATTSGEWGFRMEDAESGPVGVITMRGLLADAGEHCVSVLKCDVEGAEAEVFADCSDWIGGVESMVVECHNDRMTSEQLLETLSRNGANLRVTHMDANPHLGFDLVTLQRA